MQPNETPTSKLFYMTVNLISLVIALGLAVVIPQNLLASRLPDSLAMPRAQLADIITLTSGVTALAVFLLQLAVRGASSRWLDQTTAPSRHESTGSASL